jgi:hypothetical protein
MRNREPEIEVLPSPAEMIRWRSGAEKAELDRLVQEKVAEIMAQRDAFVFEPFFRSRQIAYELKRLQTVSEQQKWSVRFERKGCLACQTKDAIHVGCGMCQNCYPRIFLELTQIIAEGITGEPAQPARGTPSVERLLLPSRPMNAPHRTYFQRSSKADKALYSRVAQKLGIDPSHVRAVAIGSRHSERVSAALKEEQIRANPFGQQASVAEPKTKNGDKG